YWDYLVAFTYFLLVILLVSLVLLNAGTVGMDFWLSHWSDNDGRYTLGYFVGIYGAITAATSVVTLVHQLCWAYGGTIASRLLHHDMLARVLRSPISFFDATPVGRILNRFSGDVDTVDKMLPSTFQNLMSLSTRIVSTFIVQAIVFPFILISMLPLALIYFFIQSFYRHSSRELKRLDSITKSPVYATLSECLSGVSTLRAFQAFRRFDVSLQVHINRNASVFLRLNLINRWMGLRLDWLGSLLVAVTCLITVLTAGKVEPGLVGLALSYSFSITSLLNWLVRSATETETNLSCVERIETYSKLVTERPPIVDACRPPREWPSAGAIEFRNLMLRYRPDLPPVLQGVNISIAPGEKVGICGRTGSGKSSLMLGLFRMLEAQEGSIHIDGINIADIGLDDLRERLAIIPQDPVLFNGTLRYNLDPTHTFNEESMWQALESVQMAAYVRAQSDGLDMHITDGGGNLSTGQRQLLCLARSLMRDARVLVLDEATASTDVNSDAIIQRRLRELHGVTQLTIAHRIDTILDSDKILVLEAGRVLEFAPPAQLLADPNSAFAKLVRQSAAHSASTH
ncbi:MAG: ATP-binding cassette domain-containing protein, partial [Methanosarcinales archaeon]